MDQSLRERRTAELRVLQFNNPRGLIEHYCKITGEPIGKQMPNGVSFSHMIDTIVDHEAESERPPVATE
jgi:hypothetical protein